MRDYAIVRPSFWSGETGRWLRAAGPEVLLVAQYLLTCPASNMIGLYYLPLVTLAHETGIPLEGARKALRRASEGGFAHYDDHQEVVWIPEMARYQIADRLSPKDNRVKAIVREVQNYRKSPFYNDFIAKYGEAFNLKLQAPSKPLASPFEAPCKPLRSQDQDQDQDQELSGAATPTAPLAPQTPPFNSPDLAKAQDASDGTEAAPLISNPDPPDPDRASARASQPGNLVRQPHKTDRADVRLPHNSTEGAAPLVLSAPDPPARKRAARKAKAASPEKPAPVTGPTWAAYAAAYAARYGEAPVSNKRVNGQLKALVERIGAEEAPQVAAFYVSHPTAYYAARGHAVGPLLQDAEKLRTEWATNTRINPAQARLNERAQANPFLELVREEAQGDE